MKPDDPRHGTWNGYHNLKCRCDDCKAAWAAYCKTRRENRHARLESANVEHGRESTYLNWACRCRPCTTAHSAGKASRR